MNLLAKTSTALLRKRHVLVACVLAAAPSALGCASPQASFDDFTKRYDEIYASKPPTACPDPYIPLGAGEGDGEYLLVLSAVQQPDNPILFLAAVTTPADGGGVNLVVEVTPLDKTDRKTPVGMPQAFEKPALIDDAGKFSLVLDLLAVPKQANTVAPLDVEANLTLAGNVCGDASFSCGDVTGKTVSPSVNLDGSTFTLMAVDDPMKLPEPLINCEETPAKPL